MPVPSLACLCPHERAYSRYDSSLVFAQPVPRTFYATTRFRFRKSFPSHVQYTSYSGKKGEKLHVDRSLEVEVDGHLVHLGGEKELDVAQDLCGIDGRPVSTAGER